MCLLYIWCFQCLQYWRKTIFLAFQGIRVQVKSVYIESRSQPSKGQYFFAYRIRITNNSDRPVQLLRRHWIITDANGRTENIWWVSNLSNWLRINLCIWFGYCSLFTLIIIFFFFGSEILSILHHRGTGVIGEQPVILSRTGFEYSSACPLTTPSGRMVRVSNLLMALCQ